MTLKVGGSLTNLTVRLTVNYEEEKVNLPMVMSSIRGDIDADRFVMIGSKLGAQQQSQILTELIQIFTNQIRTGWKPKFVR